MVRYSPFVKLKAYSFTMLSTALFAVLSTLQPACCRQAIAGAD
jgi:hypothetical protein